MNRRLTAAIGAIAIAGATILVWSPWATGAPHSTSACGTTYAPALDPADFVSVIDNPYFPLPVGRKLVYRGVKDGQTQKDVVTVTARKKVILGISTTVVHDRATHAGKPLEDTFDFYAQAKDGTVWYYRCQNCRHVWSIANKDDTQITHITPLPRRDDPST